MTTKASRAANKARTSAAKGSQATNIRTNQQYDQAQASQAALAPQMQQLQSSQMANVNAKQGAVQDLQAVLRGEKPSLAESQLRQSTDRNLAQQLAMRNQAKGGNIALAMRGQQNAMAQSGRDLNAQAAQNRIAESMQARGQLLDATGQSENLLTGTQGQSQALYAQQAQDAINTRLAADMQKQQNIQAAASGIQAVHAQSQQQKLAQQQQNQALAGAAISAAGTVAGGMATGGTGFFAPKTPPTDAGGAGANTLPSQPAANPNLTFKQVDFSEPRSGSDKNIKKDIKSESNPKSNSKFSSQDFLNKISANSYKYKPSAQEDLKTHFSTMAQDLEKAGPIGSSMVEEGPQGKVVNYGKGFGAILASQVQLNKRIQELESKKNKKS